jgi:hydroxymethylpyrimidine pyrophosphatase-like HAD family hydrolase
MNKDNKWVIFDLDGTLADIDQRRKISKKPNGKINWDIFFDPKNISLDQPNHPVIHMAKTLKAAGHNIAIFSGRSKATKQVTIDWLNQFDVPFDVIKMRPTGNGFQYMKDDLLKQRWLDDLFPDKSKIVCVFDDRNQVVDMWRSNGITCMQVAPGDF